MRTCTDAVVAVAAVVVYSGNGNGTDTIEQYRAHSASVAARTVRATAIDKIMPLYSDSNSIYYYTAILLIDILVMHLL